MSSSEGVSSVTGTFEIKASSTWAAAAEVVDTGRETTSECVFESERVRERERERERVR